MDGAEEGGVFVDTAWCMQKGRRMGRGCIWGLMRDLYGYCMVYMKKERMGSVARARSLLFCVRRGDFAGVEK